MISYKHYMIIIISALIITRLLQINYNISDENVYINMANQIREKGLTPYDDLFLAHPPLLMILAPFTQSIITIRIALLIIQLIIIIYFNKILSHYKINEGKRLLLTCCLITSYSFFYFYNHYLGFELMIMWCLTSYYYYLRGKHGTSIILANIAVCTRLFSIAYVIPLIIINLKAKRYQYLASFVLIVAFTIIYPKMIYDVFLYHLSNKSLMAWWLRLLIIGAYIMFEGFIFILFLFKKRLSIDYNNELFIALSLLVCVSITNISFFMYYSIIIPFLLLSIRGLNNKYLSYIIILFIIVLPTHIIKPSVNYNNYCGIALNYSLPVTGDIGLTNLMNYSCNIPLLDNEFDTSVYRFDAINGMLDKEHYLLICNIDSKVVTICNKINLSNGYKLLLIDDYYAIYEH